MLTDKHIEVISLLSLLYACCKHTGRTPTRIDAIMFTPDLSMRPEHIETRAKTETSLVDSVAHMKVMQIGILLSSIIYLKY